VGIIVAVVSLIATVLVIRSLNRVSNDYDTFEWPAEQKNQTAEA